MIAVEDAAMLEEKLKGPTVAELKRQAANQPKALKVESSPEHVVDGRVDLHALAMVVAGSMAGGP